MKIQKFVTYAVVAVVLAMLALDISLPFRFPGDTIFWEDVVWPEFSLIVLCVLLIWGPKLSPAASMAVFLGCAFFFVALAFTGLLFSMFAILFLFALFAMYVGFSQWHLRDRLE